MIYKHVNTGIIVTAILLGIISYATAWSIYREYQLVTSASLILMWVLLIVFLIRHVGRTNRELARLIMSLEFDDTSNLFDTGRSRGSQQKLFISLNKIILAFRELKIQKEKDQSLLESTIDQAGAGMLVVGPREEVVLCNKTFKDLLGIKSFIRLNQLNEIHPRALRSIRNIQPGQQELLELSLKNLKSFEPDDRRQLILNAGEIILDDRRMKIITIQNILYEIERSENAAWEKLLRILNHEIMNSVSPINLLSASLIEILQKDNRPVTPDMLDDDEINKILLGLKTIRKRGHGLVEFVESYRALTKISEPVLKNIDIDTFIREIITLMSPELDKLGIPVQVDVNPEGMIVRADESLLQQTMINLLRNALHALEGQKDPFIRINAMLKEDRPVISVIDNGSGIEEEMLDKVFTPFFTSHKEGSGIGLSLARQVMKIHHGTISVSSKPDSGSVFTLYF